MKIDELFPDAGPEDWKLYLEHTLVLTRLVSSEAFKPVHVQRMDFSITPIAVRLEDMEDKKKITIPCHSWDVELWHPPIGMYSFRKTAVEVFQSPLRQNKKGICDSTIWINNFFDPVLQIALNRERTARIPRSVAVSLESSASCQGLFDIFQTKKRFFSLNEAFQQIKERRVFARALTDRFVLTAGLQAQYPATLWYSDIPVGNVDDNLCIIVSKHLFFQEVFDAFSLETEVIAT